MTTPDEVARRLRGRIALILLHKVPVWLSTDEPVRLDQRSIARWLDTSQPIVSRALSELIDAGALERVGKGPGVRYRLSSQVAWPHENPANWPAGVAIMRLRRPDRQLSGHEVDSLRSPPESGLSSPPPSNSRATALERCR